MRTPKDLVHTLSPTYLFQLACPPDCNRDPEVHIWLLKKKGGGVFRTPYPDKLNSVKVAGN